MSTRMFTDWIGGPRDGDHTLGHCCKSEARVETATLVVFSVYVERNGRLEFDGYRSSRPYQPTWPKGE